MFRIDPTVLKIALLCYFIVAHFLIATAKANDNPAEWLAGAWGVRVVLPGGVDATNFDTTDLIRSISNLKTPKWVMLNLSAPSWGGLFTAPSPLLDAINSTMAPRDDVFLETASSLQRSEYRILVYFAAQGPDLSFLKEARASRLAAKRPRFFQQLVDIESDWKRFLRDTGEQHHSAVASHLILPYSKRYGTLISGWWFDHGHAGDYEQYRAAAKSGNPDALIAWNQRHIWIRQRETGGEDRFVWGVKPSFPSEEFTAGHITPSQWAKPWDRVNDQVIDMLERDAKAHNHPVYHLFVPVQSDWRGGDEFFPLDKLITWTERILGAGGAVTWALALDAPEFKRPGLLSGTLARIQALDEYLMATGYPERQTQ